MPCDVCGKPLKAVDTKLVSPGEMRLIAQNGYGETVTILAGLPVEDRRKQFAMLTLMNDTDWALCPRCHDNARPYMAEANPDGVSQADLDRAYDLRVRPMLEAMANEEDARDGPTQAWPKLPGGVDGPENPLQAAMNRHLTEDSFACPSCGRNLLYVEAANLVVSPLIAETPEWEIPNVLTEHVTGLAAKLDDIGRLGFREELTREPDAFECRQCEAPLSLARAFAGQYPKPSRDAPPLFSSRPRSEGYGSYAPPKAIGGGGAAFLIVLVLLAAAGGAFFYFTR